MNERVVQFTLHARCQPPVGVYVAVPQTPSRPSQPMRVVRHISVIAGQNLRIDGSIQHRLN